MWFSLPNFACYDATTWVSWFAFASFGVGDAGLLGFGMAVLAMFCGIPAVLWCFV